MQYQKKKVPAYGFGYFVALLAESKPGIPDILLFSFSYATVLGEIYPVCKSMGKK
jgi:hypothetical protein